MNKMCENFDEWKPMDDDFKSVSFNSYSRGPAAQLPINLNNTINSSSSVKRPQYFKLYIDGFSSLLTETGLNTFLCSIGCKPSGVKIIHSKDRLGHSFSFVDFQSKREASKAIELIKSQKTYKLYVSFASTESDKELRETLINKEKEDFRKQLTEMRPKITLENGVVSNSNRNSFSPILSDSGGSGDTSLSEAISSLATSNKLVKVLQEVDADCSYCNEASLVEHVHLILSDQQVIDPSQLPELIEMNVKCLTCGTKGVNLKLCSQCKIATYCSRRCQSSNWIKHRQNCKPTVGQISGLDSIDSERSLNSIPKKQSEIEKISQLKANSSQSNLIKTPNLVNNVEPIKQNTPLTINVNLRSKEKVNESSNVLQEVNHSPLLQIVNESSNQNESLQLESSSKTANLNSVQAKSNRVIHKIVPFRGDLLLEELNDGEENVIICFGRDLQDFYLNKTSSEDKMRVFSDELNEKMNDFPQLPDKELKVGTLCGGIYAKDGVCYRARIVDKVENDMFALHFIDYGNTEPVKVKDIKALPPIFFECKAQAIHCTLNNIVPIGNSWDLIAVFGQLLENQNYTKVKIFEKTKEGIYKIDLFDKNGKSLIDELVEKKICTIEKSIASSGLKNNQIRAQQTNDNSIRSPKVSPQVTPKKNIENLPQVSPKIVFNKSSLVNFKVQETRTDSVSSIESNGKIEITSYLNSIENNSIVEVYISEVFNAEEFQYWGLLNADKLVDLSSELASHYSSAIECIPREGDILVVKSNDNEFNRAYILEVNNKSAKVLMIDSGFTDEVNHFYKISSKFAKIPALTVLLYPKTKDQKVIIELEATKELPNFEGLFIKQNDQQFIKIANELIEALDYKSAIDLVIKTKDNTSKKDESPKVVDYYSQLSALKLPLNKRKETMVLFQEEANHNVFYVAGNDEALQEMLNLCATLSKKFSDEKSVKPKVGNVYLAQSSDGDWYRAMVTNVDYDKCRVLFVDFGNEDDIDPKFIMNLTPDLELSTSPAIAVKCEVHSSDFDSKDLHKKISQACDGAYLLKLEAIQYENAIHYVQVY